MLLDDLLARRRDPCSLPSVPEMRARILGERAETSMVIAYNHDSLARVYEALGEKEEAKKHSDAAYLGCKLAQGVVVRLLWSRRP